MKQVFGLALALLLTGLPSASKAELIKDGEFFQGHGAWWASGNAHMAHVPGQLCADVASGARDPWDAMLGLSNLSLTAGETYRFSFVAEGTAKQPVSALIQLDEDPWTPFAEDVFKTNGTSKSVSFRFKPTVSTEKAQIVFQLGGGDGGSRFCVDNVSVVQTAAASKSANSVEDAIRINQVTYLPEGPKRATLITDEAEAQRFTIVNKNGVTVAKGASVFSGFDASSGVSVHTLEFSSLKRPGDGYQILVGNLTSPKFSIGRDAYGKMRIDALGYFYLARSGEAIDGSLVGAAYARPAGHVGKRPNKGDTNVGCLSPGVSERIYAERWTCDYRLDVSGGWYDAGDHGKYVVNGGIAVAQLMDVYERGIHYGGGASPIAGDRFLRVPESGNGVPDILDEARHELEFMLAMQVPRGKPMGFMVHHKIHDDEWTGLPLLPHLGSNDRHLHRPSTAATLNLAASAAQGARLFAKYDAEFAKRLLRGSILAYQAAKANPALFQPDAGAQDGGGDYPDSDVSDEFYWAAVELFITTGDKKYLTDIRNSGHFAGLMFTPAGFDWANVAALAQLHLATIPSELPRADLALVQRSVLVAADTLVSLQSRQPFGHSYAPEGGIYDWGSNHLILQNMIVLAAAYDISGEKTYLSAARESMDYLLGRNVLGISYVTGYGTTYARNQHSRWFAQSVDPDLPRPPDGTLAGGPNSSLNDGYASDLLAGCAPQACYVDHIDSWSTNEMTINWNAPLAFMASFLADAN